MEYDKTIQRGAEPFNCMNTRRAFLLHRDEKGYFSNELSDYENIAENVSKGNIVFGRLEAVSDEGGVYKCYCESDNDFHYFEYYLPVSYVHETENWRPYTPEEFKASFFPGQTIYLKNAVSGMCFASCYKGFFFYDNVLHAGIDGMCLTLDELFEGYRIMKDKEYIPFGVKESEQKKTD